MAKSSFLGRVSAAATIPRPAPELRTFDVAELFEGPVPIADVPVGDA